jgi:hypothetical protein
MCVQSVPAVQRGKKAKWMKLGKICSKQTVDTEKCISLMDSKNQAK